MDDLPDKKDKKRTSKPSSSKSGMSRRTFLKISGVSEEKSNAGELRLEATLDEDGMLSGTIAMAAGGHGGMKWTAERLKAKK